MAKKKDDAPKCTGMLRITAPNTGFRRAGREWIGVTEISTDELTADQIEKLKAEPRLTVEEI